MASFTTLSGMASRTVCSGVCPAAAASSPPTRRNRKKASALSQSTSSSVPMHSVPLVQAPPAGTVPVNVWSQAADYQSRLPLATLKTGDYLLTVEATDGKTTARRDVRFRVKPSRLVRWFQLSVVIPVLWITRTNRAIGAWKG